MARRNADGDMYRLILWPGEDKEEIFGPYDKLSTAKGVARLKANKLRHWYGFIPWKVEVAYTTWDPVEADSIEVRKVKLEDLIAEWHDGQGEGQELHEYLGLTWEEYKETLGRGYIL